MAFDWHELQIDKIGSQVDFYIDGLLIASDPDAATSGTSCWVTVITSPAYAPQ